MRAGELKVRNEDNEIMTGNEKIGVRVKNTDATTRLGSGMNQRT